MKIRFSVLLVILIISSVLLACSAPAPTPTPTPTSTPPPVPQTFTLKYAALSFPNTGYTIAQDWYLTEVENRTQGRVKFERYWSNTLVPATEMVDALRTGICDSGLITGSYHPGKTPLLTIGTLPATFQNQYESLMAMHDLYQQVPAMGAELAANSIRYMSSAGTSPMGLLTKTRVGSLPDIKGLKIRSLGDQGVVIRELGGVPIEMVANDMYDAMAKGTLDGTVFNPSALTSYGLHDVNKYYWQISFGGVLTLMVIRQQTWDSLPKDIQNIMEQVSLEHPEAFQRLYQIEDDGKGVDKMKAAGVTFTDASADDQAIITNIAREMVWSKWEADMEAKGLPGTQAFDTFMNLVKKYAPMNPLLKK